MSEQATIEKALRTRLDKLTARMREQESLVRAIQRGEVDAVVILDKEGASIQQFTSDEPLYRTLVDTLPQGVATVLSDGSLTYVNHHLASMLGLPAEALLALNLTSYVAAADQAAFAAMLQRAVCEPQELAVSMQWAGGAGPVLASAIRLPISGVDALGLVLVDLSDQVARRAAEEASRAKDELIASVSHEMRTPLTSMMGWLQLLEMELRSDSNAAEALRNLKNAVLAETKVVDDLLDLARSEKGALTIDSRELDLRDTVRMALSFIDLHAQNKGLSVDVDLPAEPLLVRGDPDRLRQVFVNLLSNAVKFTANGGVTVRGQVDSTIVTVDVIDTGLGILDELRPLVFEPFWRSERAKHYPGLGIGLAITRRLVEAHGGTISVFSDGPGHGATFTVKLPLA